jgi:hypothetical protein
VVRVLGPILQSDISQSRKRCSKEIIPEIFVAIGLHYLSGGSYDDIRVVYGVSIRGFYCCRNIFFKAILTCYALKIHHPEAGNDWDVIRSKFHSKSE